MDIFEKQQTIEAIKTVIKARWFYAFAIFAQGLVLKLVFYSAPLPSSWQNLFILAGVLMFNFIFWLYLRQPTQKINELLLKIIRFSQIPLELGGLAAVIYYSGTANKILIMMFIVPIMVGSIIYKRNGIILATFSSMVVYSALVIAEYFGLLAYVPPEAIAQAPGKSLIGQLGLVKYQLICFNMYIFGAAFYAGYLSDLFKRREKRLVLQKNELVQKTDLLTLQTHELTQAQDQLQGALTRSDISRKAATQARDEMEKANIELKNKMDELEKFYNITIGREVRMSELKSEIKELKGTIKKLESDLSKKR